MTSPNQSSVSLLLNTRHVGRTVEISERIRWVRFPRRESANQSQIIPPEIIWWPSILYKNFMELRNDLDERLFMFRLRCKEEDSKTKSSKPAVAYLLGFYPPLVRTLVNYSCSSDFQEGGEDSFRFDKKGENGELKDFLNFREEIEDLANSSQATDKMKRIFNANLTLANDIFAVNKKPKKEFIVPKIEKASSEKKFHANLTLANDIFPFNKKPKKEFIMPKIEEAASSDEIQSMGVSLVYSEKELIRSIGVDHQDEYRKQIKLEETGGLDCVDGRHMFLDRASDELRTKSLSLVDALEGGYNTDIIRRLTVELDDECLPQAVLEETEMNKTRVGANPQPNNYYLDCSLFSDSTTTIGNTNGGYNSMTNKETFSSNTSAGKVFDVHFYPEGYKEVIRTMSKVSDAQLFTGREDRLSTFSNEKSNDSISSGIRQVSDAHFYCQRQQISREDPLPKISIERDKYDRKVSNSHEQELDESYDNAPIKKLEQSFASSGIVTVNYDKVSNSSHICCSKPYSFFEQFEVWNCFLNEGWRREGQYFVQPWCDPRSDKYILGIHYFSSIDDVVYFSRSKVSVKKKSTVCSNRDYKNSNTNKHDMDECEGSKIVSVDGVLAKELMSKTAGEIWKDSTEGNIAKGDKDGVIKNIKVQPKSKTTKSDIITSVKKKKTMKANKKETIVNNGRSGDIRLSLTANDSMNSKVVASKDYAALQLNYIHTQTEKRSRDSANEFTLVTPIRSAIPKMCNTTKSNEVGITRNCQVERKRKSIKSEEQIPAKVKKTVKKIKKESAVNQRKSVDIYLSPMANYKCIHTQPERRSRDYGEGAVFITPIHRAIRNICNTTKGDEVGITKNCLVKHKSKTRKSDIITVKEQVLAMIQKKLTVNQGNCFDIDLSTMDNDNVNSKGVACKDYALLQRNNMFFQTEKKSRESTEGAVFKKDAATKKKRQKDKKTKRQKLNMMSEVTSIIII